MLQPGDMINETYRVEKLLGSGGMADVYMVAHTRLPRKFALKVMHVEQAARQSFLERFSREGEILATLRHPHIVDVVDRNQLPDGSPYLVMELLEGEDLSTYLARTGVLSIPVALRICSQIGDALEAAHKVGVVHRDLKPSNIFLSKEGQVLNFVKVLDFGIAKVTAGERPPMTAPAALMGTPAYMSPEQAKGHVSEIDTRTDQFAIAAMLYEMLTGRGAFYQPGDAVYAILNRVIHEYPAPLREPQLNRAVMRALSKAPEQRFPTLREFLAAVGATTHTVYSIPNLAAVPPGTLSSQISERVPRDHRRPWRAMATLGLMIGIAAVALTVWPSLLPAKPRFFQLVQVKPPTPVIAPSKEAEVVATPIVRQEADMAIPPDVQDGTTEPLPQSALEPTLIPIEVGPVAEPETDTPKSRDESCLRPAHKPVPRPASTSHPAAMPTRRFVLLGINTGLIERGIMACAQEHLGPLHLSEGTNIQLERSGTLSVVDAPASVYGTGFNLCVRQALSTVAYSMLPQSAVLRLIK